MFRRKPKEPKRLLPKPPGRFSRWRTSLASRIRDEWKKSRRETKILYQARWNRLKRLMPAQAQQQRSPRHHYYVLAAAGLVVASILSQSAGVPVGEYFWQLLVSLLILMAVFWGGSALFSNREKVGKHKKWIGRAVTAMIVVILGIWGYGAIRNYVAERREKQAQIAHAREQVRRDYLSDLASSVIVPTRDTLTILVGSEWTKLYVSRNEQLVKTCFQRANPSAAYASWTRRNGTVEHWPGEPKKILQGGGVKFRSLGEPFILLIWTVEKGSCKPIRDPADNGPRARQHKAGSDKFASGFFFSVCLTG